MELLPPSSLFSEDLPPSAASAIRMVWKAPGGEGAQVVVRRLLENRERQPGDTSLNRAAATGEERPKPFSIN